VGSNNLVINTVPPPPPKTTTNGKVSSKTEPTQYQNRTNEWGGSV